jgi:transcription elongation factor Elf1
MARKSKDHLVHFKCYRCGTDNTEITTYYDGVTEKIGGDLVTCKGCGAYLSFPSDYGLVRMKHFG